MKDLFDKKMDCTRLKLIADERFRMQSKLTMNTDVYRSPTIQSVRFADRHAMAINSNKNFEFS